MEMRKIKKLIDLLEKSNLCEIELKEGEDMVRLARNKSSVEVPMQHYLQPTILPHGTPVTEHIKEPAEKQHHGHLVRSPMVGTFYAAASPESQPFTSIGQRVKLGDVLCIVEAMKMFNEIESDREGKVIEVLVKNGDPVEYDQPLFVLD